MEEQRQELLPLPRAEGGRQPCCVEPGQPCQVSAAATLMGNAGQSLIKVPWISCHGILKMLHLSSRGRCGQLWDLLLHLQPSARAHDAGFPLLTVTFARTHTPAQR